MTRQIVVPDPIGCLDPMVCPSSDDLRRGVALSQEIRRAEAEGGPSDGLTYYSHWLSAIECLVAAKGVTSADALAERRATWDRAAHATPHGAPTLLENDPLRGHPPEQTRPTFLPGALKGREVDRAAPISSSCHRRTIRASGPDSSSDLTRRYQSARGHERSRTA